MFFLRKKYYFIFGLLFVSIAIAQEDKTSPLMVMDELARKFHTDSSRGAANPDADKEGDGLRRRLYGSIPPEKQSEPDAVSIRVSQAVAGSV